MKEKYIRTCYPCKQFYADNGRGYSTKHCEIIDQYNDCPKWKCIRQYDKEKGNIDEE